MRRELLKPKQAIVQQLPSTVYWFVTPHLSNRTRQERVMLIPGC